MREKRSPADRRAFGQAAAKARAERKAEHGNSRPTGEFTYSPMERRIIRNVTRLSEILEDITKRAMKSDNRELQQEALRGIQRIGKQAALLKKRLDEYVDQFTFRQSRE